MDDIVGVGDDVADGEVLEAARLALVIEVSLEVLGEVVEEKTEVVV